MLTRLLPLILVLLAAPLACAAATPLPQQTTDKIDARARAAVHANLVPGLSLAVVQAGKVVYAQGYGYANVEFKAQARPNTIYPIGSLTKQFTASAIMLLLQDGKLKTVDQPFAPLLPKLKLPASWSAITVRELLNQTSGLAAYTSYGATDPDKDAFLHHYTPQETVDLIASLPLGFTPGMQFEYCNTNYYLLGEIVAEQSGQTYDAFVHDKLFAPLGMTQTGQYDPSVVTPHRSSGYLLFDGLVYDNTLASDADFPGGAGDTQSSVLDLAKWDAALYTESPLTAASRQAMWTVPNLSQPPALNYGFGWVVDKINGHRLIWHNGSIAGCACWMGRYVDDKLTVIVETNILDMNAPVAFAHKLGILGEQVAGVCNPSLTPPDASHGVGGAVNSIDAAICRKAFDGILSGHPSASSYTAAAAKALFPAAVAQTRTIWLSLGKFQKFEPLGERSARGYTVVRCRCVFAESSVVYDFALDTPAGKIAGILPVMGVQ